MKCKKYFTVLLLCFFCVVSLTAQKKYSKPWGNQFIAVFSFDVIPNPENDFLRSYFGKSSFSMLTLKGTEKGADKIKYEILMPSKTFFSSSDVNAAYSGYIDADNGVMTIPLPLSQGRLAEILGMRIELYSASRFSFLVPFTFNVRVPKEVKYVYLGHFEFRRKGGMDYTITSVKRSDRFDEAERIVKERYGSDAELIRLPLDLPAGSSADE